MQERGLGQYIHSGGISAFSAWQHLEVDSERHSGDMGSSEKVQPPPNLTAMSLIPGLGVPDLWFQDLVCLFLELGIDNLGCILVPGLLGVPGCGYGPDL